MGNYAIGGIPAFGGIAIAPIGIGLCGIGLLPLPAGVAIGLFHWAASRWVGGRMAGWPLAGNRSVALPSH